MSLSAKWPAQSAQWRAELGVLPDYAPYSKDLDTTAAGLGSLGNKWVMDLLDCAVLQAAKRARCSVKSVQPQLKETLMDVSQSHSRRPLPGEDSTNRCLTTSSRLYSFAQRRMLTGTEHLLLQGYSLPISLPEGLTQADLRSFAGEGISLPCLATVLWALKLTRNFP